MRVISKCSHGSKDGAISVTELWTSFITCASTNHFANTISQNCCAMQNKQRNSGGVGDWYKAQHSAEGNKIVV